MDKKKILPCGMGVVGRGYKLGGFRPVQPAMGWIGQFTNPIWLRFGLENVNFIESGVGHGQGARAT